MKYIETSSKNPQKEKKGGERERERKREGGGRREREKSGTEILAFQLDCFEPQEVPHNVIL